MSPATPRWGVDPLRCRSSVAGAALTWTVDGAPWDGGAVVPAAETVRGKSWVCTATAAGATARAEVHPQAVRGNLLFVVADDLGTDKVSAYAEHPSPPATPNIDALAARGVLFRNAWALPSCSPTRATYLTGRHARRTGIGQIVSSWKDEPQLALDEVTLAEVLGRGPLPYDTSLAGKWHLASQREAPPERDPGLQGFAWYAGSLGNFRDKVDGMKGRQTFGYDKWFKNTNGTLARTSTYATTDTVDDALARMAQMRSPWFLLVSLNAPHFPVHAPPSALHGRSLSEESSEADLYDATVEAMDSELGRLLAAVPGDTTVVFLGDNGTPRFGVTPPLDPADSKGSLAEGGVGIPLIVASPLVAEPGSETQGLVHTVDLFTTAAVLAGFDVRTLERPVDGISLLPYLAQPELPSLRPILYTERFLPNGPGPYTRSHRAVRDARFKLLQTGEGRARRLRMYDLQGRVDDGPDLLVGGEPPPYARPAYQRLRAELARMTEELESG